MKRFPFILTIIIIPFFTFSQENKRIDNLQQEINNLKEKIDSMENEIQNEILANGYHLIVRNPYSYYHSDIKLKDKEYGVTIDSISIGDSIVIVDKTTSCFKVLYKGKTGFISTYEIETTDYPALNFLKPLYLRNSENSNSNYSTGAGGSVHVKGYYRKDGTYVKPHTRSAPKKR